MAKKKSKAKRPRKRSHPTSPPELHLLVACDAIAREPHHGKATLYGLFDLIWVEKLPATTSFSVYAKISGDGLYAISIEMVPPGGKPLELGAAPLEIKRDGFGSLGMQFTNMPLKRVGTHQIQLKCLGKPIGKPIKLQVKKKRKAPK